MFTCSSGVSFLRNFPKNRVHDAASHSLSLSLFCLHFRCFTPFRCVLVNPSVFSPLFSLLRVVMVVLSVYVFVPAPVYWCDPRGFVLHGLRKNLTNFECVYFLFPSKIVCFLCALFLSLCVCLKTQNATPKCTQPNPSAPKGRLIFVARARFAIVCVRKQTAWKRQNLTTHRCLSTVTA